MAIVWPCPTTVEQYAAAGRSVEVSRPDCPACCGPMGGWSGYWRTVREGEKDYRLFVPRARCASCSTTHALLPAFCLTNRLFAAETIGTVVDEAIAEGRGVRPAARRHGVIHETARGWVRRFRRRAADLAARFAALVVELGGDLPEPIEDLAAYALLTIRAAFEAASRLPGWAAVGLWRFTSTVSGGGLIAANTTSLYLVIGTRRFMAPVPTETEKKGERDGP